MRILIIIFYTILGLIIFSFTLIEKLEYISATYKEKIIENKKIIVVEGETYFRYKDYLLVTNILKPIKSFTRVNFYGDIEVYDFEKNTVFIEKSNYTSSQQSYLWYFLTNNYSDMGLAKSGYSLKDTKMEDNALVNYWIPKINNGIKHILIAFNKKQLPIYQEIISSKNEVKGKIYFMNYHQLSSNVIIPTKIVDIYFKSKKDSVISIKEYSNFKLNQQVNPEYFNFKIPANAQLISK